jgi:hypothetical protein
MKRASQRGFADAPFIINHTAAPVTAKVVKGANRSGLVTQDQGSLISHVKGDVGSGFGKVADMAGKLPMCTKNNILFQREKLIIAIGPAGQALPVPSAGNLILRV